MRRSIVLAVTVAIAISGCIGVQPPATPGTDTSVATPGGESPPSTPEAPEEEEPSSPGDNNTGGQGEPSAFARRETAPGGVSEFLEAVPGGGIEGPCIVNPPEELPGLAMHTTVIPTSLCGQGFIAGEEVALLLRGPGGREWTAQITTDNDGAFEWGFERLPGRLQGEYFAQAIQGEARVDRTFDVRLDSLSAAVVPRYFPPGGATELVIAGGQPAQSVPVHLYRERSTGGGWDFIADLGPLALNDNGQVRVELSSHRRDERGTFMVVVEPDGARIGYWFVLGRSDAAQ
jgi:hypothetical protein